MTQRETVLAEKKRYVQSKGADLMQAWYIKTMFSLMIPLSQHGKKFECWTETRHDKKYYYGSGWKVRPAI